MIQAYLTAFSYLVISQLLFTSLVFITYYRKSKLGLLISLLSICLIAVSWSPFPSEAHPILSYIDGRIAAATIAVLWLFGHELFLDDRKVKPWEWFALIGYQVPRGFVAFPDQIYSFNGALILEILNPICLLIAFGLAIHVIVMAVKDFGNDLLEERRRLRGPFAAGLGVVMAMLVATLLVPYILPQETASAFAQFAAVLSRLVTFVFFLAFNLLTLRPSSSSKLVLDSALLGIEEKPNKKLKLAESDLALMEKLDRRMLQEKLFAHSDLSIGQLAGLLEAQEYKLRLIINRELGYKNFNQFLNQYRINEACKLLKLKSKHRNIAIVAQAVGYNSVSTFNQAFKRLKGITPTEYKAQHRAENAPSFASS